MVWFGSGTKNTWFGLANKILGLLKASKASLLGLTKSKNVLD